MCDAPREYGPPKTLYKRWKRWGDIGVFARMMEVLAFQGRLAEDHHDQCDTFHGVSHGFEPADEEGGPGDQRVRLIGRAEGGLNTKLRSVTDAKTGPLKVFMTAGEVGHYTEVGAPAA